MKTMTVKGLFANPIEVDWSCVFAQTTVDEKGYPIRDEHSTSYGGAIETTEAIGSRIYAEALGRGG